MLQLGEECPSPLCFSLIFFLKLAIIPLGKFDRTAVVRKVIRSLWDAILRSVKLKR